jgi:acetyl-CoA acetyltransferase
MADPRITGVGHTLFGRHPERTLRSLAQEAAMESVQDAGLDVDEIDAVVFSNSMEGLMSGQEAIRGQVCLRDVGLLGRPMFNVEGACASGSSAVFVAQLGVRAGEWRNVLVVGAEKLYNTDRSLVARALQSAADLEQAANGGGGPTMMELYAESIRMYMDRSCATVTDFARVVAKNRRHASKNPLAQFRQPVSIDEVLAAPMIAAPLTRLMCSPIADGAAALVLSAANASHVNRRHPRLLSCQVTTNGTTNDVVRETGRRAYDAAGLGPADLDLLEVHDGAAPAELYLYEKLGLAREGEGAALIRSGAVEIGGRSPVNTSGGLIARGHPIGATGLAQIVELVLQLQGRAGDRQVDNPKIGLAQNAGGDSGGPVERDPAVSSVTILARSD